MANEPKKPSEEPRPAGAARGAETKGDPLRRFGEGYERYARAVQTASSDADKRIQEAAQKLLQEQQDAAQKPDSTWDPTDAQRRFLQEQQEAWTEAQRRYEEAFRGYLDGLRGADLSGLDPGGLAAVGQSLQAAASLAQCTMGSWNVVGRWVTQQAA